MLHIFIYTVAVLGFSYAYASEDPEIHKTFNNIAKYIKVGKDHKDTSVIEKKSNKFNIRVTQNSGKTLNINLILKQVKDSLESGDKETAVSLLNKIIEKFPYHKNSLVWLGNIHFLSEDYKKAYDIYIKLLKEYPGDQILMENFFTIALKYNPETARDEMLKLYDTHKNYAPLLASLSLAYLEKKELLNAKKYMAEAASLDQENIFYIYNLAIILDQLSDLENAKAFYEKLLNKAMHYDDISTKIPVQKISARLNSIRCKPRI
ncbi:MAG: tetratricopeptide repeat protein [Wolbachia endosymbiont of Tyrophagus putrescentiae]|nr:tetratricopeptide repeat protein [Wolbachia endosymbiont of Tyrophagus putrescentiae]